MKTGEGRTCRSAPTGVWVATPLLLALGLAASAGGGEARRASGPAREWVDLSRACVVLSPDAGPVEKQAARMLVEEAAERSGIKLSIRTSPVEGQPVVTLGTPDRKPASVQAAERQVPRDAAGRPKPESFGIAVAGRRVSLVGADPPGCVFAVGRLLRELRLPPGRIEAPVMTLGSAPAKPLRGHQLGWRPKSNTYDRWGLREYEQYLRDLALWGVNAIELIPGEPGTDAEKNLELNARLADLIHSYGMQVWFWYPLDDVGPAGSSEDGLTAGQPVCPSRPAGRRFLAAQRREFFRRVRHVDAVFIPGGDPGGCPCERCQPWERTLLPLAEEVAGLLRERHPKAQLWLSNQGFEEADNRHFYGWLHSEGPGWLTGLVYAPWAHESLASMRARTPDRYPIRLYPDVTHTVRCQFPARDWDQAFALTLDREPPIYRPSDHAHIARLYQADTRGTITYSDGVNDDLNKIVWSARLWDPDASVDGILRDYSRYFFGAEFAEDGAAALRGLERNETGPLAGNRAVAETFERWTALEKRASPALRSNWRFAMALLRGYHDRYVQLRLEHDTKIEREIHRALETGAPGPTVAVALGILDRYEFRAPDLRERMLELGQVLYDQVGMQLSVPRWGASGDERGAILDHLDVRLANLGWLEAELRRLKGLGEAEAGAGIRRIVRWEDPGPGGFYDDLGNPARQPHLFRPKRWEEDPGCLQNPRTDFRRPVRGERLSWNNYAESLYESPIVLRYEGLDPNASYVVRAVYSGRYRPVMTLTANDTHPVHGPEPTVEPTAPREWPVPREATRGGTLTLAWKRVSGRGAQVSEVWLIKR